MNNPELFESVNFLSRRDNNAFVEEYETEIGKMSGRCLDVGSGPGNLTIDILLPKLNPGAFLFCSDISESMVKFAEEKYKDNSRLAFMKLDIESSHLPNQLREQFDHVTSFYCLHWCQNLRQVFGNIFDLLRPGGTAFLTLIADFPTDLAYKYLATTPRYEPYMKDVDRYIPYLQRFERPRHALRALLKDGGFEVHSCNLKDMSYVFEKPDVLKKLLVSLSPFVERLPPDLTEAYANDMLKEVVGHSIILNKDKNNEEEFSTLVLYHVFVVYLKKPSTE